ncbi:hypothetical protein C2E23DRAFT_855937 [Lenzites betulinus]|nr:hypothetical protein C2E23DRAFT_855937 [Lenzites betulinus]
MAAVARSAAVRIIPTPPRIGASQTPQSGVAIAMPSRAFRPPAPSPVPTPAAPPGPPSTADASYPPPQYPYVPPAMLGQVPTSMPFAVDSSQIDPQLMGPSGLSVVAPAQSESDPIVERRPNIGLGDVPLVKTARPQRTSRKGSNIEGETTEDAFDQGDTATDGAVTRTRRSKQATTVGDENASQTESKKRKRSETSESRRSRKRAPSPPAFDPDADPGEELDPTAVTMAALCDDNGRGRVSSKAAQIVSNHAAWRTANRDKRARMKAAMEAKKYGRDDEDDAPNHSASHKAASSEPEVPNSASRAASVALEPNASSSALEEPESVEKDGFNYNEDMAISRFNVQVRIGANGETIIDEQSLFVNRDEEHQTEEYTHVEESDFTKFVNSATYSKKLRGSRWSADETEMFYDALSQFGENYELISYVLPGRDRKACKNKFKAEDKKNSARITYCLQNRRPYVCPDIATLSRMTGKDFSGPTPEIRAPTPLRSTELETIAEPAAASSGRVVRKKSKTPSIQEAGVEIIGDIDDVEKDEYEITGAEGVLIGS